MPALLIDVEKEHYFKIKDNSGRVHEILKNNGVPTEYHLRKGKNITTFIVDNPWMT